MKAGREVLLDRFFASRDEAKRDAMASEVGGRRIDGPKRLSSFHLPSKKPPRLSPRRLFDACAQRRLLLLRGALFLDRGLRSGEAGDGYAEG